MFDMFMLTLYFYYDKLNENYNLNNILGLARHRRSFSWCREDVLNSIGIDKG